MSSDLEKGKPAFVANVQYVNDEGETVLPGTYFTAEEDAVASLVEKNIVRPIQTANVNENPELMQAGDAFILGLANGTELFVMNAKGIVQNASPITDLDKAISKAESLSSGASSKSSSSKASNSGSSSSS